jgi:Carboxymuconolactone decarboxylase family
MMACLEMSGNERNSCHVIAVSLPWPRLLLVGTANNCRSISKAKENGLIETELKEVVTHLAFYAGWPKAMSALTVARQVFKGES